jgi:iron complex transport system permease protein
MRPNIDTGVKYRRFHLILAATLWFLTLIFALIIDTEFSGFNAISALLTFDIEFQNIDTLVMQQVRLPRVLTAAICGGALAMAGAITQGYFRNPLASPSILGIESGATAAAALASTILYQQLNWMTLPLAAVSGSLLTTFLLLILARKYSFQNATYFLLLGLALATAFSAITTAIISFNVQQMRHTSTLFQWLLGSFDSRGWHHVGPASFGIMVGLMMALRLAPPLDALMLGENIATSMGVPLSLIRTKVVVTTSILVGTSIAAAGGLPFVSLIVPHLVRIVLGPSHRNLLWGSFFCGSIFVVFADLVVRLLSSTLSINAGAIIALIGAPLFLLALLKQVKDH